MDVTSLLNTTASAAVAPTEEKAPPVHARRDSSDEEFVDSLQASTATTAGSTAPSSTVATPKEKTPSRWSSDSRTPSRNRTPWDAGGYSLSLALDDTKRLVQDSTGAGGGNVFAMTAMPPRADPAGVPLTAASPEAMDLSGGGGSGGSGGIGGSPKSSTSPRHKFSDSRSSFSSAYTNASSTNNSVSHSRISSLSTVSENQPLANLITDFSLLETRVSEPCISHQHQLQHPQGHQYHQHQQHQLKLRQYAFATQVPPEKQDLQPESPTPVRSRHDLSDDASRESSPRSPSRTHRTQSPSDAMLIPRTGPMAGLSQAEAECPPGSTRLQTASTHSRSHSRGGPLQHRDSPARRHKRAVSAPDFPSLTSSSFNPRFPTFGPIPEPTPSPSQHSDGNAMEHDHESEAGSPTAGDRSGGSSTSDSRHMPRTTAHSSPNSSISGPLATSPCARHQVHSSFTSVAKHPNSSPAADAAAAAATEPPVDFEVASACMYRGDCQTGSQLRKAISHIFGRNKLCTRMIPTGVWVHYCRKHYQRTRYRNGGEYPQRQIGLVQEQVRRVQAWSDSNTQQSRGPVLKGWSLSVRKREQMRLENKAATGKKRPFHDDGMDQDEDEPFDDDRAEMSSTAVPDWVVARIGDGYSTAEIMAIVDRLKLDIDQGRLQQIPDIEILPNIVTDSTSDEPTPSSVAKKTYTKRRTTGASAGAGAGTGFGGGHRRSQSVNTSALWSDSVPMARRSSQPNNVLAMTSSRVQPFDHLQVPLEKRQRVDGDGPGPGLGLGLGLGLGGIGYPLHANGMAERFEASQGSRPGFPSRLQLTHRPAFAGIRESQAEGPAYCYSDEPRFRNSRGDAYPHQQPVDEPPTHGCSSHDAPPYETSYTAPYEGDRHCSGGYGAETRREHERHHSTSSSMMPGHVAYGVLPAPYPQRFGGPSVAQQLESSPYVLNSTKGRRTAAHQRSQSEAAGFLHHTSSPQYGRPTSSGSHAPPPFGGLPRLAVPNAPPSGYADEGPGHGGYSFSQPYHYSHHSTHSASHRHHGSHSSHGSLGSYGEDEQRGSVTKQPAFGGYADNDEGQSRDKFESVQLPPLQCIAPPQRAAAVGGGGPGAADMRLQAVSEHPAAARHSRHQSSPAVTRMLPAPVEVHEVPSLPALSLSVSASIPDS